VKDGSESSAWSAAGAGAARQGPRTSARTAAARSPVHVRKASQEFHSYTPRLSSARRRERCRPRRPESRLRARLAGTDAAYEQPAFQRSRRTCPKNASVTDRRRAIALRGYTSKLDHAAPRPSHRTGCRRRAAWFWWTAPPAESEQALTHSRGVVRPMSTAPPRRRSCQGRPLGRRPPAGAGALRARGSGSQPRRPRSPGESWPSSPGAPGTRSLPGGAAAISPCLRGSTPDRRIARAGGRSYGHPMPPHPAGERRGRNRARNVVRAAPSSNPLPWPSPAPGVGPRCASRAGGGGAWTRGVVAWISGAMPP